MGYNEHMRNVGLTMQGVGYQSLKYNVAQGIFNRKVAPDLPIESPIGGDACSGEHEGNQVGY